MKSKKGEAVEKRKQFIRDFVRDNPLEVDGTKLHLALADKYPEITAGGHRGMVGRLFPARPWAIVKECPNVARGTCAVKVTTMKDGLAKFGHRYGKRQLQSHCKDCRNRGRREARAAAKLEKARTKNADA